MLDPQVIQDAGNDGIGELLDSLGAGIKGRVCRQDGGSRQQQQFQIPDMDEVERGLAGHQDQFSFLFERHIRRAQNQVRPVAVGDASEGAHGAGEDDHRIRGVGAAGEGRIHALELMSSDPGRHPQPPGQFLGDNRMGVLAEHDMHLMSAGNQVIEQALGVDGPTCPCDGD